MKVQCGAIILAAGASSRMGGPKALLPIGHQSLLEWQVARLQQYQLQKIIVVINEKLIADVQSLALKDIELIVNPQWEDGPFSSLYCGLQSWSKKTLVVPVDTPVASFPLLTSLFYAKSDIVLLQNNRGKGGHPIVLAQDVVNYLISLTLNPDLRLDHILANSSFTKERVSIQDPLPFFNLNTPNDYENFLKEIGMA